MIIAAIAFFFAETSTSDVFRPREIDPYALCSCAAAADRETVTFTGYATDAEVTLAEDGRSTEARQATIFRVTKGRSGDIPERTRLFHMTDPAKCGVKFDYGKRYDIVAVKRKDGALETSWCEMRASLKSN